VTIIKLKLYYVVKEITTVTQVEEKWKIACKMQIYNIKQYRVGYVPVMYDNVI